MLTLLLLFDGGQLDPAVRDRALDILMVSILVAALAVGLLSVGVGRMLAFCDWLKERNIVNRLSLTLSSIMSNVLPVQIQTKLVAANVAPTDRKPEQPIAKPGNEINRLLDEPDVDIEDGNEEVDISEARKIIQYHAKLELLAALINAGLVKQTEAIEKGFGCARSGRKDSKYAKVRADLLPLLKPEPKFSPETPEVEAFRENLGLPEKI